MGKSTATAEVLKRPYRSSRRYTVYDGRDDSIVAIDCTAKECARRMDISVATFYCYLSRFRKGVPTCSHYEIFPQSEFGSDECF